MRLLHAIFHKILSASITVGLLALCCTSDLQAGGSALNTIVIVNQNSSNSCNLGNYFCESRSIPSENVLHINWAGGNVYWNSSDFFTYLENPLLTMLSSRGLTNQIDYIVLSMDIPFQTILNTTNINSTTSALFYGLKMSAGNDPGVTNSYASSEGVFRNNAPASASGVSFLGTMITANSLVEAKRLVDQGVAGDGKFPFNPVILAKSSDSDRNIRYPFFDNAIFNAKIFGTSSILRTNADNLFGLTNLFGYETGLANYSNPSNLFVPGAIADSLTSYGGIIFGPNGQTSLLTMISAGASGSYGTVSEPGATPSRFPDPQVYFYQARGFSLAECYYQSVNEPFLGLTVAEPLSAPFALRGSGFWGAGISNSILSGITPLSVNFTAHDSGRPLQQVDLFVDGKFHSTLTNLPPSPGDMLTVILNGYSIGYTVPTNATLGSIASGLAALINTSVNTNATKIKASVHGDRIELQSINTNRSSFPFYTTNIAATGTGMTLRVNYLSESYPPRILPKSPDARGLYRMQMEIPSALNYIIQASTDLIHWSPIYTNTIPGLIDFNDYESPAFPARFYRIAGPLTNSPPKISVSTITNGGALRLKIESQPGQPCAIIASTNQLDWSAMITNQSGGIMDYLNTDMTNAPIKFYRAWLVPAPLPSLTMTSSATQQALVRIENAALPYTIEYCTNGWQWFPILTNFAFRDIQIAAGSSASSGFPSTFLRASRPTFMNSEAFGIQEYKIFPATLSTGDWLQFAVTKTNNQYVTIGITNQTAGTSATNLAAQLYASINTHPGLQGDDGIVAEDFTVNNSGFTLFNLRARSAGYAAANVSVSPKKSGVTILPSTAKTLTRNLSDLQPRNHLYVTAGTLNISGSFAMDTTTLPDGFHELTAVAYEGSHVRTQTRTTVPVQIRNTGLTGTMTLLDLTNTVPVGGTYHIQVAANTNTVSLIKLFSTGGIIGSATNTSSVTFDVIGTNLWSGLHPFYAIIETSTGEKYRTQTQRVRLE